jgi:hypothetical protein
MAAPEAIVAAIFQQSQARFEGFDRPWWERV